jgi:predicted ATPase
MSKIKIKNFGPIKEGYQQDDGFIDIKKVTVFIGNQGSGKSTVAKTISTLTWLEKAINRGDVELGKITQKYFYDIFQYQRIHKYFKDNTEIEYLGDRMTIRYAKHLDYPEIIIKSGENFYVPKIMYVPAERNFLSAVQNAFGIKNLPDTLYTFAEELRKGQLELKGDLLLLPIGEIKYKYKEDNDTSYLLGEDFELNLLDSSSGYQSFVPLYLVTKFLSDELQKGENVSREQLNVEQSVRRNNEIAKIMFDEAITESQKNQKVKEIDAKYLNTCFINIVEEPEQNLFPVSQQKMLNSLLIFNNLKSENKLIITTHSPYLVNDITLSVKAHELKEKIRTDELKSRLARIVPLTATINPDDLAIYELNEKIGTIKKLGNFEGIPSDKNFLNTSLRNGNQQFDSLLEIEEEL